jgi:hypothetical protein
VKSRRLGGLNGWRSGDAALNSKKSEPPQKIGEWRTASTVPVSMPPMTPVLMAR